MSSLIPARDFCKNSGHNLHHQAGIGPPADHNTVTAIAAKMLVQVLDKAHRKAFKG